MEFLMLIIDLIFVALFCILLIIAKKVTNICILIQMVTMVTWNSFLWNFYANYRPYICCTFLHIVDYSQKSH